MRGKRASLFSTHERGLPSQPRWPSFFNAAKSCGAAPSRMIIVRMEAGVRSGAEVSGAATAALTTNANVQAIACKADRIVFLRSGWQLQAAKRYTPKLRHSPKTGCRRRKSARGRLSPRANLAWRGKAASALVIRHEEDAAAARPAGPYCHRNGSLSAESTRPLSSQSRRTCASSASLRCHSTIPGAFGISHALPMECT